MNKYIDRHKIKNIKSITKKDEVEARINYVIEDDMLIAKISSAYVQKDIKYAFYLKCNDERIATKWYQDESIASFKLEKSGVYQVVGFIKTENMERPMVLESNLEQYFGHSSQSVFLFKETEEKASVNIFGSCVSRDMLAYPQANFLELKNYVARQSIVSAVSIPTNICIDEIKLSSPFQRQQVYYDINKKAFDLFSDDKSEYLLIDFIDERFPLTYLSGSLVTLSGD